MNIEFENNANWVILYGPSSQERTQSYTTRLMVVTTQDKVHFIQVRVRLVDRGEYNCKLFCNTRSTFLWIGCRLDICWIRQKYIYAILLNIASFQITKTAWKWLTRWRFVCQKVELPLFFLHHLRRLPFSSITYLQNNPHFILIGISNRPPFMATQWEVREKHKINPLITWSLNV